MADMYGAARASRVTLVLDSGAFVALERNDRAMWRRSKAALLSGDVPVSHGESSVRSGELLARARATHVIDSALVLLAEDGDRIVTSHPDDLRTLAVASGRHVEIVHA